MKIAFLIPTLTSGGAERVMTYMANFWAETHHSIILFTMDNAARPPFYPLSPGVQYKPLDLKEENKNLFKKIKHTLHQVASIYKQIKEHNPDVLIAFLDITIFLSIVSTLFLKVKVIVSERNNPYLNRTNNWLQKANNLLYLFADLVVLQTKQIKETFPSYLQHKISVIPNPVSKPIYQLSEEDYARNFVHKRIVSVGRLEPQKGFNILINVFSKLIEEKPGWSLMIIGEGQERKNLEGLRDALNLTDQIKLPGRIENPLDILKDCTVFILPSYYEGFPNALCEAMSLGLPVISTRCPFGPEEIIQDQVNGLLVPVGDVDALYQSMIKLIESPGLCKCLGEHAKQITNHLNMEKVMQQWEEVINRLVQEN